MDNANSILNARLLALLQGFFYLITGLWPVFHIESFMDVTGPKMDIWLVKTVGVLITVIGTGLLMAAAIKQVNLPVMFIAGFAAIGLMFIDVIYVSINVIPPVYLLDALAELILFLLWGWEFLRYRQLKQNL